MNFSPKTLKAIAYLLLAIQLIAFIYMVKYTWRNERETNSILTFVFVFILPLFATILFNKAKKKSNTEKVD